MNYVYLLGRSTADPEFRETANGNFYSKFTLALDKKLGKAQKENMVKEGKQTADFIRVIAWGGAAKKTNKYLRKGARVCISGSISSGSYDDEMGDKHFFTEVVADEIRLIDMPSITDENQGAEE